METETAVRVRVARVQHPRYGQVGTVVDVVMDAEEPTFTVRFADGTEAVETAHVEVM